MDSGQIILFQTQGDETKIEIRLANESVWFTTNQKAELFQRNRSTISRHIKNMLESDELERISVIAENATTASDGKTYTSDSTCAFFAQVQTEGKRQVEFYNA